MKYVAIYIMGKRKSEKIEEPVNVNSLVVELENGSEELRNIEIDNDHKKEGEENTNVDLQRSELIKLAEDGQLDQSVKYSKKASSKVINKLYKEFEDKRMQKAEFLTDLSKFSRMLGGLDAIENMEDELKKDELLRRDVDNLVSSLTPYIPYLGFVSGGITVGKHISSHMLNKTDKIEDNETVGDKENVATET